MMLLVLGLRLPFAGTDYALLRLVGGGHHGQVCIVAAVRRHRVA